MNSHYITVVEHLIPAIAVFWCFRHFKCLSKFSRILHEHGSKFIFKNIYIYILILNYCYLITSTWIRNLLCSRHPFCTSTSIPCQPLLCTQKVIVRHYHFCNCSSKAFKNSIKLLFKLSTVQISQNAYPRLLHFHVPLTFKTRGTVEFAIFFF